MLHHAHPAVVGLGDKLGLLLLDLVERDLLVLAVVGVDRHTGVGGYEPGIADRHRPIAYHLEVGERRLRFGSSVGHFEGDVDQVTVALEGEPLDDLEAFGLECFELHHQLVLAVFELERAGQQAILRQVRRQPGTDQATLRDIGMLGRLVEQHEVAVVGVGLLVLEQLHAAQVTTDGIEFDLRQIGLDADAFASRQCPAGRGWRGAGRSGYCRRRGRRGDRRCARYWNRGCRSALAIGGRRTRGAGDFSSRRPLGLGPGVGQHQDRESEDEEQDQLAGIHATLGNLYSAESPPGTCRADAGTKRGAGPLASGRPVGSGTGSKPPGCHG